MEKFLSLYKNGNEDKFNMELINRTNDTPIVNFITNACKSLEVLPNIKFLDFELVEDESQIDMNHYIYSRKKRKPGSTSPEKYMFISDSRYAELRLRFQISGKSSNKGDEITEEIEKRVLFLVPDRDGYYTIKGKRYILLYQLVDSSTYKNRDRLTLKSFMPVIVKKNKGSLKDISDKVYDCSYYTINIFKKEIDIFLFYFAKFGVLETLQYWSMDKIISFTTISDVMDEDNLYFSISSKLFVKVNKELFESQDYVRSMVSMVLSTSTNRMTMDALFDATTWIEKIGATATTNANNYLEKGKNRLISFDRMIDETTKSVLKISEEHSSSTYSIVRWMIQNFSELRKKDNMNLMNKRIRCNEYIASLLTKVLSERLNRIISLGDRATIKEIRQIFKFKGDAIITELYATGLLKFNDAMNDMDMFSKLKFTIAGPNSMGNKNSNNIATRYRGIHPSYLGRIDLNVCSSSSPGVTGLLTPMCEMDGLYFAESPEPEAFKDDFDNMITEFFKSNEKYLTIDTTELSDEYIDKLMIMTSLHDKDINALFSEENEELLIVKVDG